MGAIDGLLHGFGVAFQLQNFFACLFGVFLGNLVGVLPGLGVMTAISMLLPLTFAMPPVAAILMLAGIYYGAQYGGAICSILLNLPCHPPHAVTCLDGYPLTLKGRGGTALGVTMLSSFLGATFGIVLMMLFAPLLVSAALMFGPADIASLMLLGLLAGSTLSRGSKLKGVAMTCLGLILATIGTDVNTGMQRMTFGIRQLDDGLEIVALALGLFGIAEFLKSVNNVAPIAASVTRLGLRDLWPSRADLGKAILPAARGTLIGSLCSMIPGTGPTIASFIAYGIEKRVSKRPNTFGTGAIEGVASPEAATHAAVQGDFIPTMSLGIPGDSVMALLLGALIIQGITPGPQLITEHPDIFWGLIASFWIGNILLMVMNMPMIGFWVKLLSIPYRYLCPAALFFVCIGVYSIRNDMTDVAITMVIGIGGYILLAHGFHVAPILLGFVLGQRFEEDLRRALLLAKGDFSVFVTRPISLAFLTVAALLVLTQIYFAMRKRSRDKASAGRPEAPLLHH